MTRAQKWIVTSFLTLATLFLAVFAAFCADRVAQAENSLEIISVGGNPVKIEAEQGGSDTGAFPMGFLAQHYEVQIHAAGGSGSYSWRVVGSQALPQGLVLDPDSGVVFGMPEQSVAEALIQIEVTDKNDSTLSDTAVLSLTIAEEGWKPIIITPLLSNAVLDNPYECIIECIGYENYANEWTLVDGILPPGLVLEKEDDRNGKLYGTPSQLGTFTFTVQAKNPIGVATQVYTVEVEQPLDISYPEGKYSLGEAVQFASSIGNENVDWMIKQNRSSQTMISNDGLLTIGHEERGTYVVVYATSKTNSNNSKSVRFDFVNPSAYSITIIDGVATDGFDTITAAVEGDTVSITAEKKAGKRFRNWSVETGSLMLSIASDAPDVIDFAMPNGEVVIRANYDTVIEEVSASFAAPMSGERVDADLIAGSEEYAANLYKVAVGTDLVDRDDVIYQSGREYTFFLRFVAKEGYVLALPEDLTVMINEQNCDRQNDYNSSDETWKITLVAASNETIQYSVTVEGGVADRVAAEEGTLITVTADPPAEGYVFEKWTSADVTFTNAQEAETTFTMPAKEVTLKAVWQQVIADPEYQHSAFVGVEVYTDNLAVGTPKEVGGLFAAAKEANGKVELAMGSLKLEFDTKAVNALGGKDLSVTVFVRTEKLGVDGAQFVIEIALTGANARLDNGKVTLTVPFESEVPQGKVARIYEVIEAGQKKDMNATFANGKATFETNCLDSFTLVLEDKPAEKEGLSGGAIAGITVGSVSGGLSIATLVLILLQKKGIVNIKFIVKLLAKIKSFSRKKKKKEES